MTEAMAMLLPIMISVRWINQLKRFRSMAMESGIDDGADIYRQVCFGGDV